VKPQWILCIAALLFTSPSYADCDDPDESSQDDDCDGDGYSMADGDCDDSNPDQNPGAEEVCDDDLDNDCDESVDEGCGSAIEEGELMGGSSCGQSGGGLAWLAPLILFRRRRE